MTIGRLEILWRDHAPNMWAYGRGLGYLFVVLGRVYVAWWSVG